MTKEEAIEKLIEQVNHNMDTFIGILGIVLAAFLYFQWRLSNNQIEKIKNDVMDSVQQEYIDELEQKVTELDERFKKHQEFNKKATLDLINNLNNEVSDLYSKSGIEQIKQTNKIIQDLHSILFNDSLNEILKASAMLICKTALINLPDSCSGKKRLQGIIKNDSTFSKYMQLANAMYSQMEKNSNENK